MERFVEDDATSSAMALAFAQTTVPATIRWTGNHGRDVSVCVRAGEIDDQDLADETTVSSEQVLQVLEKRGYSVFNKSSPVTIVYEARCTGDTDKVAGFIQCLVFPGRLHVEAVKTDAAAILKQETKPRERKWLQLGALLGLLAILKARERGIENVYGLAIKDGTKQHQRLTAYMRRMGAVDVRPVGGGMKHFADRLVWGGPGMIMLINANKTARKYAALIAKELAADHD
ncbi:hypothetical protein FVE85_2810 [Porphyridium purpureum]|uniref:Uncharacterized protein n=1 Tax=Porphyridium purpureum TaxID=35688 RepID=A0A5J4YSY5_PORPP|nr:hypothetical protein FVE85_2810 [Porphyridium purpureum]|eukprot:POR9119..scf227_4